MNEELTNDEVEIDLVDLGYVLLDKWRYLLISLIAGAVLLGAYSLFFIAPTYESTAKLSGMPIYPAVILQRSRKSSSFSCSLIYFLHGWNCINRH